MKRIIATILLLLTISLLPLSLASCKDNTPSSDDGSETTTNYIKIAVKNYGDIIIELYPDIAPITVANFKKLVSEKFYDGIIFHRISGDFVIQGGDPKGTGYSGSKDTIKGEFSANGVNNSLSHTRGVISMARTSDMNSASSQFFIVLSDKYTASLDGLYAGFGKVIAGMDVVDSIAAVKLNGEKPVTDVVMESVVFITEESAKAAG